MEYCDIVYHTASPANELTPIFRVFSSRTPLQKIETIQYRAARIVTGAWYGTDKKKLYDNLGWESLEDRRTMRKLCVLHSTIENKYPRYLSAIVENQQLPTARQRETRALRPLVGGLQLSQTFFPSTIRDWNNLSPEIRKIRSSTKFKKTLLNQIREKKDSYFRLVSNRKVKYLTMLRLGLSPLKAHKHRHGFVEELQSGPGCEVCECPETTEHYLLHCRSYTLSRSTLFTKVSEIINRELSTLPRIRQTNLLLKGLSELSDLENLKILQLTTDFIAQTKRLDGF